MKWQARYFSEVETMCKCGCGLSLMDQEFMDRLDYLRAKWGKPLIVTSGYRCENHPIEASKERPGSHNTGKAVDIKVVRSDMYEFLKLAYQMGFQGIAPNHRSGFVHLDDCRKEDGFNRPFTWSYSY